jgi:hypothetical protein
VNIISSRISVYCALKCSRVTCRKDPSTVHFKVQSLPTLISTQQQQQPNEKRNKDEAMNSVNVVAPGLGVVEAAAAAATMVDDSVELGQGLAAAAAAHDPDGECVAEIMETAAGNGGLEEDAASSLVESAVEAALQETVFNGESQADPPAAAKKKRGRPKIDRSEAVPAKKKKVTAKGAVLAAALDWANAVSALPPKTQKQILQQQKALLKKHTSPAVVSRKKSPEPSNDQKLAATSSPAVPAVEPDSVDAKKPKRGRKPSEKAPAVKWRRPTKAAKAIPTELVSPEEMLPIKNTTTLIREITEGACEQVLKDMIRVTKQRGGGWLRLAEAEAAGLPVPNLKSHLSPNEKYLLILLMSCVKCATVPKKPHRVTAIAGAWGVSDGQVHRLGILADQDPQKAVERKKRYDSGETIFTSERKRRRTYTPYRMFRTEMLQSAKSQKLKLTSEEIRAQWEALPPQDQTPYVEMAEQTVLNAEGLQEKIHNMLEQSGGTLSLSTQQLARAVGSDQLPSASCETIRKYIAQGKPKGAGGKKKDPTTGRFV